MTEAIRKKDFAAFAELTMKDSNQFHATCLDTYPPIFYLNHVSQQIISLVHRYNKHYGETRVSSFYSDIMGEISGHWTLFIYTYLYFHSLIYILFYCFSMKLIFLNHSSNLRSQVPVPADIGREFSLTVDMLPVHHSTPCHAFNEIKKT